MLTANDLRLIDHIADRAVRMFERLGMRERPARFVHIATSAEVLTVHSRIMPLDLEALLGADDFNFAHDVAGIHRHLDFGKKRAPPRLNDCFVPRFAKPLDERGLP